MHTIFAVDFLLVQTLHSTLKSFKIVVLIVKPQQDIASWLQETLERLESY